MCRSKNCVHPENRTSKKKKKRGGRCCQEQDHKETYASSGVWIFILCHEKPLPAFEEGSSMTVFKISSWLLCCEWLAGDKEELGKGRQWHGRQTPGQRGCREVDRSGVIFGETGHKLVSDSEWVMRKRGVSRALLGPGPEQLGAQ